MIIQKIKYKTNAGTSEGFFVHIRKDLYVRVMISLNEFNIIEANSIISAEEVDIDFQGKIKNKDE